MSAARRRIAVSASSPLAAESATIAHDCKVFGDDGAIGGIVVHDQRAQTFKLVAVRVSYLSGSRLAESRREIEERSLSRLAFDFDFPLHAFNQFLRDGQPKTGTAIFARSRRVGLRKRGKEPGLHGQRDADPGIANVEPKDQSIRCFALHRNAQDHLTSVSEFQRVDQQIVQDLPEPVGSPETAVATSLP